jgi:site-specific recombinase XerD
MGNPYDYLTWRLRALIDQCGLPPVRLHDLRHGAASLALATGVELKVIQEMLSHSSIVTTADIYTSVLSEAAHAAAPPARHSSSTPHATE